MPISNKELQRIVDDPTLYISKAELVALAKDPSAQGKGKSEKLDMALWTKLHERAGNAEMFLGRMLMFFEDDHKLAANEWRDLRPLFDDENFVLNGGTAGMMSFFYGLKSYIYGGDEGTFDAELLETDIVKYTFEKPVIDSMMTVFLNATESFPNARIEHTSIFDYATVVPAEEKIEMVAEPAPPAPIVEEIALAPTTTAAPISAPTSTAAQPARTERQPIVMPTTPRTRVGVSSAPAPTPTATPVSTSTPVATPATAPAPVSAPATAPTTAAVKPATTTRQPVAMPTTTRTRVGVSSTPAPTPTATPVSTSTPVATPATAPTPVPASTPTPVSAPATAPTPTAAQPARTERQPVVVPTVTRTRAGVSSAPAPAAAPVTTALATPSWMPKAEASPGVAYKPMSQRQADAVVSIDTPVDPSTLPVGERHLTQADIEDANRAIEHISTRLAKLTGHGGISAYESRIRFGFALTAEDIAELKGIRPDLVTWKTQLEGDEFLGRVKRVINPTATEKAIKSQMETCLKTTTELIARIDKMIIGK